MNLTRDYQDGLDGAYLACKPGDVADGLEVVCTFGMPILGSAAIGNGLWLLYLAYIHRRHRKLLAKQIRDSVCVSNARSLPKVYAQSDTTELFSYIEKLLLSSSVAHISFALMFFVNGVGTMYPTTHIRGQIGDAVGKNEWNLVGTMHLIVCLLFANL